MKKFFFIILMAVCGFKLFAQLDNSSLFFNRVADTVAEKKFFLKIQNFNYMKNNEYGGLIADGYTLFGTQLNPQIGYQLSPNLSIETGIFLMKDFGNNDLKTVSPTFSLRYQKKDFKMVFGNIDGSLNHRLIEPLYNFERVITNRLESGAQFIITKKHYDFDAWIDWQRAIYPQSSFREQIWAGLNLNALKVEKDQSEFTIPLQGTVLHTGGQIDTSSERPVRNINYAAGLTFKYKFSTGNVQSIYAATRYVADQQELYDTVVFKNKGNGLLADLGITFYNTNILFSYWYGANYRSDFGGYLYSSESSSVNYKGSVERFRSIVIMRITKTFKLAESVFLTLRMEPYYDIHQNLFEYSYGFYINFDQKLWFRNKAVKSK